MSVEALCELFKRESDIEVCGEAENGREAIAKALELHPDLIVLDLSMPVMNGLDAARELKRLMPTVPLIMYSAFGDVFGEQQARLIGISELVSKSQPAAILVRQGPQSALSKRRVITSFPSSRYPKTLSILRKILSARRLPARHTLRLSLDTFDVGYMRSMRVVLRFVVACRTHRTRVHQSGAVHIGSIPQVP